MTELQLETLSQSPVFIGMAVENIQGTLSNKLFHVKKHEKGAVIAQSGSNCDHARIVLNGQVAGEMMDLSGKVLKIEDIKVSRMIAPAFLYGARRVYPVNVIAGEDAEIWQMHRDEFSKLLQSDLLLLNNYLNAISNRTQFLSEKIRFLSFPTLRAKLAFFLLRHSGNSDQFRLPMTHQQMAEMFGVARPSLSRAIRELNQDGLIISEREQVKIIDAAGLRGLLHEH